MPSIIPVVVAIITGVGAYLNYRISKDVLSNTKEATPPWLLRLEKWSTILKDSKEYPISTELNMQSIFNMYNEVLSSAILENKIMNLGIISENARDFLISVKPKSGHGLYPVLSGVSFWNKVKKIFKDLRMRKILILCFVWFILFTFVGFYFYKHILEHNYYSIDQKNVYLIIMLILNLILTAIYPFLFIRLVYRRISKQATSEENIIVRNGYHVLREYYLAQDIYIFYERPEEKRERENFEKSREYKEWKKKNPELTSWNYGLSISWDNNPYKSNTDGLEPNHLPPSLFLGQETPKGKNPSPSSGA